MPDAGGNLLGELHFPGSEPNSESLPGLKPDSESLRCVAGSHSQSERPHSSHPQPPAPLGRRKLLGRVRGAGGQHPEVHPQLGAGCPEVGREDAATLGTRAMGSGERGAGNRELGTCSTPAGSFGAGVCPIRPRNPTAAPRCVPRGGGRGLTG